jgi:lipoprotein-releasing system ATP-binding protein
MADLQSASEPVLSLEKVDRIYEQGGRKLPILEQADFFMARGEFVALVGPSGAGKSTILHIAGLLERPTGGKVRIGGQDCGRLPDAERTRLRRDEIGFVYQFHHLLPEFSALENVALPQRIAGQSRRASNSRARELLDLVGLTDRLDHRPAKLSGGEQQRVAIARAVANGPSLLLADEPTGNLDPNTAGQVFGHLEMLLDQTGQSALVATHNMDLARRMSRAVTIENGKIVPAIL